MRKKALVTGILGQDGAYLARLLLEQDYRVFGMLRRHTNPSFSNTDFLGITDRIEFIPGDMTDQSSLMNLLRSIRPDEIYNLAAQSFVGASWDQAIVTTESNALGVLYLLQAMKQSTPNARFYQASTSEMFGNSSENGLQTEDTPFHPRSPYAIAKLYAYWITNNFKESYGLYCANGILFNHESPIRGLEFVTRKISHGVAGIKLGLQQEIRLGNLDSKRDWGFAGDYVQAMWLMLQQSEPDNYIVSTGDTHSIREFLDIAFRHVGINNWQPHVVIDPRFKRPAELFSLHGTNEKARRTLNWQPTVSFAELVTMMVDADLARLSTAMSSTTTAHVLA